MLPDEIYADSASSAQRQEAHPLNHKTIDDDTMRARLAYDLMTFMSKSDSPQFAQTTTLSGHGTEDSKDEIDIMILDGFYKEAGVLIEQRLQESPKCDKTLFQSAFLNHIRAQYKHVLEQEERILKDEPRNVTALINKGFALANLEREDEALKITNKALDVDPENVTALGSKVFIAKLLGDDELEEQTLADAYNVSAKHRREKLEREESQLLQDFTALMSMEYEGMPNFSAHAAFNQTSMIH